jgi:hypothetical protein
MKKCIRATCSRGADSCKPSLCREHYNAYCRNWCKKNQQRRLEIHKASRKNIYKNNRIQRWKDYMNSCVKRAIDSQHLVPKFCSHCGGNAQAHHDSYLWEDRLKVRWLCQKAHAEWHRNNKPLIPSEKQMSLRVKKYIPLELRVKKSCILKKRINILFQQHKTRKQIAKSLKTSYSTVRNHLQSKK